jgi:hypothetical protein
MSASDGESYADILGGAWRHHHRRDRIARAIVDRDATIEAMLPGCEYFPAKTVQGCASCEIGSDGVADNGGQALTFLNNKAQPGADLLDESLV